MEVMNENWSSAGTRDFWGGIGPSDHVVHIYDENQTFLSILEGFVAGGIAANDCVVVIATDQHLRDLEDRLRFKGNNVFELKLQDQYIPLSARDTLEEIMINNWPDEVLFRHLMNRLIGRARSRGRNVRAFGEMAALLWAQGNIAATVQLENLWNKICYSEKMSLFCAYPRSDFNQMELESILHICGSNSIMIRPDNSRHQIFYRDLRFTENRSQRTG